MLLINPTVSPNQLKTTLMPHRIFHGDACFAYFNKIWGIPDRHLLRRFDPQEIYFEEMDIGSGVGNANPLLLKLHGSANWFIDEEEYDGAFSRQNSGAVARLVGIEGGVVSGVFNLESSGVGASDRRPRHDERYHEDRVVAAAE